MIFNRNIVLEDSRILLRPVEPNDRDGLRSIFFDDEIWEYTVTKTSTEDELTTFINDALYNKQNAVRYTFTIIDKISGEIAGSSSFGNLSEIDRCVEIGWSFMGRKFWGTHVNIHAKFQMLQFAFEQMKMNRVEFKTDDANPRSGRALIKIGCKKEGVLRSRHLLHNGRMRDTAYYSILADEWENTKETVFAKLL